MADPTVVMFAGQSNNGYGNTGPAPYTPSARVQIWTDVNGNGAWDFGDNFTMMVPGVNTGNFNNPTAWGAEVEFANRWLAADPEGSAILFVGKSWVGETPLAQRDDRDWSPASDGEAFDTATFLAQCMRANLGVESLDAVFWMQGETDATNPAWAASYADNLQAFLSAARAEWMNDADGYVGIGRITDSTALTYSADVRYAQWLVDQLDPHAESFKTIGFDLQPDGIHYAAGGHLALGASFFDAWAF